MPRFTDDLNDRINNRLDRDAEVEPTKFGAGPRRAPKPTQHPLPGAIAAAIENSITAVFAQKGMTVSPEVRRELANNSAQSVVFVLGDRGLLGEAA